MFEANFEFPEQQHFIANFEKPETQQYTANLVVNVTPTLTSQLVNDGQDGISPFVSEDYIGNGLLKIEKDGQELGLFHANQKSSTVVSIPKSLVEFSEILGSPYDNTNLSNALNDKWERGTGELSLQTTGTGCQATGEGSHAEGIDTIAQSQSEHAEGQYNKSHKTSIAFGNAGNTIHSIGIGNQITNRKNAFEVMQNGDAYLYGVGEYDGTNYDEADTIQEVINSKQPTISDIETIRSNAQAGKSASDTIATYGNIVTEDKESFATSEQGAKADSALQPNDNVSELVNDANYTKLTEISATSPIDYNNVTGNISVSTGYTIPSNTQINTFTNKQDKINDLETIRNNATAGKSAKDTIDTYGNIVTENKESFATASQGSKADSALQQTDIIDVTTSTATDKVLSANQGKVLQEQINNLLSRGKYLSIWDCTTGLAMDELPVNPYTIETGSYFIVGKVASEGGTNYRPNGGIYDKDVPSRVVEIGTIKVNDTYYWDSTQWRLLDTPQVTVAFSTLAGSPYDNTNLSNALDNKYDASNPNNFISRAGISATSPISYNNSTGVIGLASGYQIPTTSQITLINNAIQPNDNVSDLTNDVGYITGITGSDVTTALGYIPYNATNPNNYISRTGISATTPISYNNSTGIVSVASGHQIPTTEQITLINNAVQPDDITNMEVTTNKTTSISTSSTDTQYPSAKAVYSYHDSTKYDASNPSGYLTLATLPIWDGSVQ